LRRRRLVYLGLVLAVFAAASGRACVLRPATSYPGSHFNRGVNAAWLDIDWVNEPKPAAAVTALARDLERHQVRDAFVYVSYLNEHGAFNPTYAQGRVPGGTRAGLDRAAAQDLGRLRAPRVRRPHRPGGARDRRALLR
jgi:hypothetical protein